MSKGIYDKGRPKKYDAINKTGKTPPKAAGEYRVKDKDGKTKYVGITNNLDRRVKEHKKTGNINSDDRIVEWMAAKKGTTYEQLREHERQKIKQKKPYANKTRGGEGPVPKYMDYVAGPSNESTKTSKKKGCYIATAVYGSYDCPEVWTLRRYRDFELAKSIFGRFFIRTYYALSPIVVKLFGKQQWFIDFFKVILDGFVQSLNNDGIMNTPYEDKDW